MPREKKCRKSIENREKILKILRALVFFAALVLPVILNMILIKNPDLACIHFMENALLKTSLLGSTFSPLAHFLLQIIGV